MFRRMIWNEKGQKEDELEGQKLIELWGNENWGLKRNECGEGRILNMWDLVKRFQRIGGVGFQKPQS